MKDRAGGFMPGWRPTLVGAFVMLSSSAHAMFIGGPSRAPVERVIANIEWQAATYPDDPVWLYILGRLHTLAYVQDTDVQYYCKEDPYFPPVGWQIDRTYPKIAPHRLMPRAIRFGAPQHLRKAIAYFEEGLDMIEAIGPKYVLRTSERQLSGVEESRHEEGSERWTPERALYYLGLAYATDLYSTAVSWGLRHRQTALDHYVTAFELSRAIDAAGTSLPFSGLYVVASHEASQRALELIRFHPELELRDSTKDRMAAHLAVMRERHAPVTPLVMRKGAATLSALVASDREVLFDIDGDGQRERISWLAPGTGLLVWDPERSGVVRSGIDLFGSVTWWIFWRNGFEPLATLDDNRDGLVRGDELDGLALWIDGNGDGVSDPGEVTPLDDSGVLALATVPEGEAEGVLWHSQGALFRDGSWSAVFDWIPNAAHGGRGQSATGSDDLCRMRPNPGPERIRAP